MELSEKLEQVCRGFRIEGEFLGFDTIQVGNVNKTYEVKFRQPNGEPKSYLVQNVNTYAFRTPIQLMNNIDMVTEHIRAKKAGAVALHFHHTPDRKTYIMEGSDFWRMTNFIPSITYSQAKNNDVIRNAGRAFGEFQTNLADFDSSLLTETIPNFHNTVARYQQLADAVAADPVGRVAQVQEELAYLESVREQACRMTVMKEQGLLPVRVTHNDTKINNVLFNPEDDSAMVVIDLDTVMPGLVGHDFGDAIRFVANRVEEDSKEPEKAGVDMEIFKAFAEGFLEKTANALTDNEVDTLALSCFTLAVELSTRFLADYILGDPYFTIRYPEHNLVRTRCQIALAKDMQRNMAQMEAVVHHCVQAARA